MMENSQTVPAERAKDGMKVPQRSMRLPKLVRAEKELNFATGPQRYYDRHSGSGRPLNENPKKQGGGAHNWGRIDDITQAEELVEPDIEDEGAAEAGDADWEDTHLTYDEWLEKQDQTAAESSEKIGATATATAATTTTA